MVSKLYENSDCFTLLNITWMKVNSRGYGVKKDHYIPKLDKKGGSQKNEAEIG